MPGSQSPTERSAVPRPFALTLIAAAALVVVTALAYHAAPDNTFHFDDFSNIVENPATHVEEPTPAALLDAARETPNPRRVLANASFAIDWWRGGGDPRPFQWTNLAVHGAAALAVFALLVVSLRHIGYRPGPAVLAALLAAAAWAGHPIQAQAVTYIVQRMASLAALFVVVSVLAYLLARLTANRRCAIALYCVAVLAFVLGLASKENAAITPALVLLAEFGVVRHRRPLGKTRLDRALIVLPAAGLLYVVLDLASGSGPLARFVLAGYETRDFSLAERLLTQPRVIAFHFSQLLWPLPGRFSIEHDFTISTGLFTPPSTAVALAGVALWCAGGLWALFHERTRIAGFFLLWVPASLAIESSAIALEMVFEHRMYLPTVGLAGLAALAIAWAVERGGSLRVAAVASGALVVALLVAATAIRVPVWRDRIVLAEDALAHAPNSARAWSSLGKAFQVAGRWDEAEAPMRRALALDPDDRVALDVLAVIAMDRGDLAAADRLLARRLMLGAVDDHVINSLGELRLAQGRVGEAIRRFEAAAAEAPSIAAYRWNLALAYERADACDKAHAQWLEYLALEEIEADIETVRDHLRKHYESEGGRCFGYGG